MSTRLTNAARDKIIAAALEKSGINNRIGEARTAMEEAKMDCWVAAFGGMKVYRRLCERLDTIDTKIEELRKDNVACSDVSHHGSWGADKLNLGGMQVHAPNSAWFKADKYQGLRLLFRADGEKPVLLADNPLIQKFLDAEKAWDTLRDDKINLKNNIAAVVYSVNTTKRLIEVWPEAAELIPADIEVIRASVPAINFESLNAAIGIPSEKKA